MLFRSPTTPSTPTTPTTPTTTTTQPPTACLTATFTQTSTWDSGYGGSIKIANSCATATNSWAVEFDLPAGTTVSSSWSSVRTSTGQHHKFTNAGFNGTIKPGATASFGFNAAGHGLPTGLTASA